MGQLGVTDLLLSMPLLLDAFYGFNARNLLCLTFQVAHVCPMLCLFSYEDVRSLSHGLRLLGPDDVDAFLAEWSEDIGVLRL